MSLGGRADDRSQGAKIDTGIPDGGHVMIQVGDEAGLDPPRQGVGEEGSNDDSILKVGLS